VIRINKKNKEIRTLHSTNHSKQASSKVSSGHTGSPAVLVQAQPAA